MSSSRFPLLLIALVLLTTGLAGCLGDDAASGLEEATTAPASPLPEARSSHAVVAVIDSGINPYHIQFRDDTPEALLHPSTYIEGYPADASRLNLSLDEPDWETAVQADCDIWNDLEPDQLYWVAGTRIIGIQLDEPRAERTVDCAAGEVPVKGLDTAAPHGTGATGRVAGDTTSLCPDCKIVMTQMGQTTWAMKWAADQPWIDVQSNSWGGFFCHQIPAQDICYRGPQDLAREATERQVTFAASGNGIRYRDGITLSANIGVGIPTYLKPAQGHEGVIVVGGHDNGEVLLWPGTVPHVVADSWNHPSAAWDATATNSSFGGTSGSTPFAAGTFAAMVLEARRLVGDTGTGLRDGNLVVAADGAQLPETGPLADGALSRQEAEGLFMATATARPSEDAPYDGDFGCRLPDCTSTYQNTFIPWSQLPDDVPAYYLLGYGQVGTASLALALDVLGGEAEEPERPIEDELFQLDASIRRTLQE